VVALLWFRRGLRVEDLPALNAAVAAHDEVVPVFCFDDRLLGGRHASGPRTRFLLESLADLDASLRERGARLVIRRGRPERELVALAEEVGAANVHYTRDVTPFARERGEATRSAFAAAGLTEHAHPGHTIVDDAVDLATKDGRPYTVFSPYWRNWMGQPRREVLTAPERVAMPDVGSDDLPTLADLGLRETVPEALPGGERAAEARLDAFLAERVHRYGTAQDDLGADATSRMSPYLHLGCISPRAIEARLMDEEGKGPAAYRRQLAWGDFYHHVIYHHPDNARHEHQQRYRGTIEWTGDEEGFAAWCEGRTGYPLVDAAMRQLLREGWIHNRGRLVVGSFLTKHLGIDWRWGERFFMRLLIDGDESVNNGNWQWIGSVGTDPAPYYRRLYNPAAQQSRHDPRGVYVRRHVPELEGVPDRYLAEPWTMPAEVQREAGCVIGRDYPEPIVDHREAREAALARYRAALARDDARAP
jgi:deoxyribodipyrimidine photo-lyase